jgi:thiamine monophosphate synthase
LCSIGSSPSGSITEANIAQIWQAGADSAAIISDLLGAHDCG